MNIQLLIIDPQVDFMDGICDGALAVPGAYDDMSRLAAMIERVTPKLADIHVTMDSHRLVDIAHPIWWMDATGKAPAPFTIIKVADVEAGIWQPRNPAFRKRSLDYVRQLEAQGNYPLCIWPPHCLIGTTGHAVHPELTRALRGWEEKRFGMVDYVTKGSNPWTEHYSAIQAEVPDPTDPSTSLNTQLLKAIQDADIIAIAGEALSHCVKSTVTDIANNIGDDYVKKFVFLTDASSNVPGFENFGADFLSAMQARGMQLSTTATFLS